MSDDVCGLSGADLEKLFRTEYRTIRGYVGRRVEAGQAEDVTSEIFVLAVRAASSYRPSKGQPRPWLFGIAHNHLRNHARSEARRFRAQAATAARGVVSTDDAGVDQSNDRIDAARLEAILASALQALPRAQRDVLLLSAWADLSPAEIATVLNTRPATVRSRLSKARSQVREHLKRNGQVVIDT